MNQRHRAKLRRRGLPLPHPPSYVKHLEKRKADPTKKREQTKQSAQGSVTVNFNQSIT